VKLVSSLRAVKAAGYFSAILTRKVPSPVPTVELMTPVGGGMEHVCEVGAPVTLIVLEGETTLATTTVAWVKVIGLVVGNELVPDIVAVTVAVPVPRALTLTRTCETTM